MQKKSVPSRKVFRVLVSLTALNCAIVVPVLMHRADAQPATNAAAQPNPRALLSTAITKNDLAAARTLLEKNPELINNGSDGYTPLSQAVSAGNRDMVALMVDKGADVNATNRYSSGSPLYLAVQNNKKEIVQLLLDRGARVVGRGDYYDPLFSALQSDKSEIVTLLLSKNPELNRVNREGFTPLTYLVQNNYGSSNRRATLELLLQKGAKINEPDARGLTALHAVLSGYSSNKDTVEFLLSKGADPKIATADGRAPLHIVAAQTNNNSESRSTDMVALLVDKGANINARSASGDTPLHLAAQTQPALLEALLTAGADANVRNNRGEIPLHVALRSNQKGWETNLIPRSDVNVKDRIGLSPLLLALMRRNDAAYQLIKARNPKSDKQADFFEAASQNNVAAMRTLITEKPFLPYWRLSDGTTAAHVAALWTAREAIDLLVLKGADVNARDAEGQTPLLEALSAETTGLAAKDTALLADYLVKKRADVNAVDLAGETPLHAAVSSRNLPIVQSLLAAKANPNLRAGNGLTPIFYVTANDYPKELARDMAAALIRAGADVNIVPSTTGNFSVPVSFSRRRPTYFESNGTLLRRAVARGNYDLVVLLLEKGAIINDRMPNSEPVIWQAVSNSQNDIAQLLVEKGADVSDRGSGESLLIRVLGANSPSTELITLLLDKGADINGLDSSYGETPLTRALNYGRDKEIVKLLLDKGADVNAKNSSGDYPVFRAISNNNKDHLVLLLDKGAKLDIKNNSGETPLAFAKKYDRTEFVTLLTERGAKE